jgi:hypothetical protein
MQTLKAPEGATHVQTRTRVYEIRDGRIAVEEGSPDLPYLLGNGFTVIPETHRPKPDTKKEAANAND